MPPAKKRSNGMVRRDWYTSNVQVDKIKKQKANALKLARKYKQEYASPAAALGNTALFLGGSAAAGVVRSYQPYIGNMPTDVLAGVAFLGAGFASKKPKLIYLAGGMLSAFTGGYAQEQASRFFYGEGSVSLPSSAAGGS